MIGLDTNVLVRHLVNDDEHQARKVKALFRQFTEHNPGYISLVTLAETVWVLVITYDASREKVTNSIEILLETPEFLFENEERVVQALSLYREGKADLADYLITAGNEEAGCKHTVTFDRVAAKSASMKLL